MNVSTFTSGKNDVLFMTPWMKHELNNSLITSFAHVREVGDFLSERFASEPVPLAKHIPDIKISNKPKLTHSVYYFNSSQLVPLFFHLIHKVH